MKLPELPLPADSRESSAGRQTTSRVAPSGLSLLAWFALGLLTALPGLWTRSLHYDEALEAHLAQLPIADQYAPYAKPAALDATWRAGLLFDSPHLYNTLSHPVLSLLGTNAPSIRIVAWLAGGLLVPLAFVLLRSLFPNRLAILATLGFAVCAWRVELAQMGRPHGLFLAAAMLSLITFPGAATSRSWASWLAYSAALTLAVQTSYWGILVVIPSHFLATVVLRRQWPLWRRAVVAQAIAGATSLYYASAILVSYGKHSVGDTSVARVLAIPLFARCLSLFSVGSLDMLDLPDLPLVAGITLLVFILVVRGAAAWWRAGGGFAKWLGASLGLSTILLFVAHFAAAALSTSPMERKFALLLAPLLISFTFGVSSLRSPGWRRGVMVTWIAVTAFYGLRAMNWDPLHDSDRVTAVLAAQRRPLVVYSNRDLFFHFLIGQAHAGSSVIFHPVYREKGGAFGLTAVTPTPAESHVCLCLFREGYYLRERLKVLTKRGRPADVDANMRSAVAVVTERFAAEHWRRTASAYFPGRVSYQVACFAAEPGAQAAPSDGASVSERREQPSRIKERAPSAEEAN